MTPSPSCSAWIGLGSNLRDPRAQIGTAIVALSRLQQSELVRQSSLYRSAPWGLADQPEFVNAVVQIDTSLSPQQLMQALLAIEQDFGRQRSGPRWGPRILDLDMLLYADRIIDEPGLRVPHPHLRERAFVLLPLAEISPDLQVPGLGPVRRLLDAVDVAGCRKIESA